VVGRSSAPREADEAETRASPVAREVAAMPFKRRTVGVRSLHPAVIADARGAEDHDDALAAAEPARAEGEVEPQQRDEDGCRPGDEHLGVSIPRRQSR